jgi:hypothetical protein
MPSTEQVLILSPTVTLLSTEMSNVTSNAGTTLTTGVISAAASTNYQGDGKGNGYPFMNLELHLVGVASNLTAGTAAFIWFLLNIANQETGSGSIIPGRPADVTIPITGGQAAQTAAVKGRVAPVGTFYILLAHNTGVTWTGSSNTLIAQYYTRQGTP